MSAEKPKKPRSSTKKSKADLEARIAELEAKLNSIAAQAKPAEVQQRPPPPPAPKPQVQQRPPPPPPDTKPTLPKPEVSERSPPPSQKETAEVAPAYSSTSSSTYTGNRYYATRQRLAYHPPDKQFTGQTRTVQVYAPEPEKPRVAEPEPMAEPEPQREEPRRIEPPTPRIKFTGDNYYKTKHRLAYHPPNKQFKETVAVKFEETPSVSQVQYETAPRGEPKPEKISSDKRSKAEQLAEYEKEYLERLQRHREEAVKEEEAVEAKRPKGTMPAGWKPS